MFDFLSCEKIVCQKHGRMNASKYDFKAALQPDVSKIPNIVRLRNGPQKLVLISRMDTRICASISDWLVSYAPCDWSYYCEIYHAMLKINNKYGRVYILCTFASHLKRSKRLCLFRPFIVIKLSRHRKEKRKRVKQEHNCRS